ncbi:40S ribosomal protein S5 [Trifolium repens]|nr:40S ribosomal protein S5 [Trifolium repens]
MSDIVQEPIVVVSYPSQVKVKLFNRWSFDDVQSIFTALFARLTQIKVQLGIDRDITYTKSTSFNYFKASKA